MMRFLLVAAMAALFATDANAGNLEISPITVDVAAPSAVSSVMLRNNGNQPVKMQARLFSWAQGKAGEQLAKTNDVVVSPPFVEMKPNEKAVIRIVRLSKSPVAGEESYRLLVDELPNQAAATGSMIQMVMRYSIPVFFTDGKQASPSIDMGIEQHDGKVTIAVGNHGTQHLKLSGMKVSDTRGNVASFGNGLNGYVLAGASKSFSTRGSKLQGSSVTVSVISNFGQLVKTLQLR
jgi:fimbrial chaperone protein